ncbi:hypothetical protein FF38_14140 [Lucilia cuprina]|uniref:Uncharacterized protein n=1 Tax=Lucilia cuprina TaxID=7375 RepID=A0A0L0C7J3_LUCCU|nr:hypothetical protein FF38_14140 [Lucilia cuprina]
MTSWLNGLLRFTFCHGAYMGFASDYLDTNGRVVKLFKLVKVFVLLQNLLFLALAIRSAILEIGSRMNNHEAMNMMSFAFYLCAVIHTILLRHSLILFNFNQCFTNLNNQLVQDRVDAPFGNIFFKISLLLEKVNVIFGPHIFWALLGLLFVEKFTLGRLTLRPKITICRMFSIDLNSLFVLAVEIILSAIMLTQSSYFLLQKTMKCISSNQNSGEELIVVFTGETATGIDISIFELQLYQRRKMHTFDNLIEEKGILNKYVQNYFPQEF